MAHPPTYDFNKKYEPLPVHDQGQKPICFGEQWANHLRAFGIIHDNARYDLNPNTIQNAWQEVVSPTGTITLLWHTKQMIGKDLVTGLEPQPPLDDPQAIKQAIWDNGVLQVTVPSRATQYEHAYDYPSRFALPVLHYTKPVPNGCDHSNLVVGYTRQGIIVLNSWGLRFGKKGRAVLAWDFVAKYGLVFEVDTYIGPSATG